MFKKEQRDKINTFLETCKPLSRKIAAAYLEVGKNIGLSRKDLNDLSFAGAIAGYTSYLEKSISKRKSYKVETYLTWWMRRAIHVAVVRKILDVGLQDKEKAEKLLLDFLE